MIVEKEHEGKLYFYELIRAYQGRFVQIHQRSEYETQRCRELFRKKYGSPKKGNAFVQECALKGLFDGVMTEKEIILAKRRGILPEAYDVHHLVPLSLGGENTVSNLCVIHRDLHTALHKEHLNLVRDLWDEQKYPVAYLHVPTKHFLTMDDLGLFFTPKECQRIQNEAKVRAEKAAYHAMRRAEIKDPPVRKKKSHVKQRPENLTPEMINQINKDYQYQQRKLKKQREKAALKTMSKKDVLSREKARSDRLRFKEMQFKQNQSR